MTDRKIGDLRVWWIPQIPMDPFYVPVDTLVEGVKLMDTLAAYDAFQFENNVKPDYANVGGFERWDADNGDGVPGWCSWIDEETAIDDPFDHPEYGPEFPG